MVDSSVIPSDLAGREFKRILLVKPSSLGDVVHALPVLGGLRKRFPDAQIDWLVAKPFVPFLKLRSDLDGVVPFDRKRFSRVGISPRATMELYRFLGDLRRRRYDLVVDLQGLFRTGFMSCATGAGVRIGFRESRELAWIFYSHAIGGKQGNIHAVDWNYLVAKLLGFADVPVEFDLDLNSDLRGEARDILKESGISKADRLVAVVPGARWETKVWPAERFSAAIDELQSGGSVRCVLIGSGEDVEVCERIMGACHTSPINLTGRTTICQLASVIEAADLVLCHDSAAAHLAVALSRPLVCLVGPTNPKRTGPYGRMEDVLRLELECSPCYLRRLSQCRHGHKCMVDLEAHEVVSVVNRALAVGERISSQGSPA